MSDAIAEFELRNAWRRLRMVGDFETAMRHSAVRRAVESAARAMRSRRRPCERPYIDTKRRAANDTED
jgi:hypothetical protein